MLFHRDAEDLHRNWAPTMSLHYVACWPAHTTPAPPLAFRSRPRTPSSGPGHRGLVRSTPSPIGRMISTVVSVRQGRTCAGTPSPTQNRRYGRPPRGRSVQTGRCALAARHPNEQCAQDEEAGESRKRNPLPHQAHAVEGFHHNTRPVRVDSGPRGAHRIRRGKDGSCGYISGVP